MYYLQEVYFSQKILKNNTEEVRNTTVYSVSCMLQVFLFSKIIWSPYLFTTAFKYTYTTQ